MDDLKLNEKQKLLVEKLGVFNEKSGLQPVPARILALLLVSDNTELTFDEIRETLNISKSAASNALNLLLTTSRIEYLTKPGDRKRYFRSRMMNWKEDMKTKMQGLFKLSSLFNEVLEQRTKNTPEFNSRLQEIIDFLEFLHSEMDELFKKWENKKK